MRPNTNCLLFPGRASHAVCKALVGLAFFFCLAAQPASHAVEVGQNAPDFELPATDGKTYRLSDFEGKSPVILAWFPRAFTSGCTIECKSLVQNGARLRQYAVRYFMISVDPLEDNQRFADSLKVDFPLLSDATKSVARTYGVLYQERFALRQTLYIDITGKIVAIDSNVDPINAAEDMISILNELNIKKTDPSK